MMRRLAVVLLSLAILVPVFAKQKPKDHIVVKANIHCFKIELITEELREKFGEEPIFVGKSEIESGAVTTVFVNQETGSYTVMTVGKGVGCILDVGSDMRYRMPKMLENKHLL